MVKIRGGKGEKKERIQRVLKKKKVGIDGGEQKGKWRKGRKWKRKGIEND